MIGVAVAVVVCLSVVGVWKMGIFENEENYPIYWDIYMEIEKTDEGWVINVTDIVESNRDHNVTLPPNEVTYKLTNRSLYLVDPSPPQSGEEKTYVWKNITEIKGKSSIPYNITWNDNDYNDLLSVGDTFFISSAGGNAGKAETGYKFELVFWGCGNRITLN